MAKQIQIRLKNTDAFRKWQKLKAAAKAVERKLELLHNQAGLPKASQFKKDCVGYFVDGNSNPVAKFSVYRMPAREIPPCRVCRIS